MADNGRPAFEDSQYEKWLEDMMPFLKAGNTLYYAMEKADLLNHQTTIYEKYRLKDWFSQKVDKYRAYPGELINNMFYKEISRIQARIDAGISLTREELETMKHYSEKHRTAQPFFVNRYETAQVDPDKVGNILDDLEGKPKTDYGNLGSQITEQSVAPNPPLQNQN